MHHSRPRLVALTLALVLTGAVEAHGGAPGVAIRTPDFGFSYGAPIIHRYGYHYAPRWNYGPAPYPNWYGYGHRPYRFAVPRHNDRHRRHFDGHDRYHWRDHRRH
ncbi:MAG: hypothetical protein AB7Q81_01110 [Gammaproteobacteria bacterium]